MASGMLLSRSSRFIRDLVIAVAAASTLVLPATAGPALKRYSDSHLAHGFYSTVFGIEHGARSGGHIVKKFHVPVRFRVENHSAPGRERAVANFITGLSAAVPGLDARLARPGERANFDVHIVDRASYAARVRSIAFGGAHGKVPGRCMVKVDFTPSGIHRSAAFIVADEGEHLFKRCMIEEILQGLGPMNDDSSLTDSVFNDTSTHARLQPFDRAIVAMLYDDRVRHGMRVEDIRSVLPGVVQSVRKRIR